MRLSVVPADRSDLRHNSFDAMRLGLALAVVWSHAFALWHGSEDGEWISLLLGGVYNAGNLGVLGFFTISGFLIARSYVSSRSVLSYLRKRVSRIYPGYLAAVLICSLVVVPAYSSRPFGMVTGEELVGLTSNLLLKNYIVSSDAFGGGPVNGSLWSIPYEFWCYLGVIALGLLGWLKRPFVAVTIAGVVMLVRSWLDWIHVTPGGYWIDAVIGYPYFWFIVLPSFLLGTAVFIHGERLPRNGWLLAGGSTAAILLAHVLPRDPYAILVLRLLIPPLLAYAIFYLGFHPTCRLPHAARYGDFSYGAYLYAFPIQQMLVASLKGTIPFPAFVVLSLVLSVLAGVASWYLVEQWFLPRVRRIQAKPESSRPLEEEALLVAP
ncbi:acyltransferase family protein [Sphingomonas sp. ID0503]|uniref:acyltransferase family protein n=1 Tax=Sphingomonas sp. ID0503 TaxID=3399691 RepID=UPI003AFAF924